jgi:uncharacterized phage protein (TIGR01671 family)
MENKKIKFKVWDNKGRRFLNDVPMKEAWIDTDEWDDAEDIMNEPFEWTTAPTYNNRLIWLQFTGFIDKNGKEIYEGDIVKYTRLRTMMDGFITYAMKMPLLNEFNEYSAFKMHAKEIELIGNIYENPELLNTGA